MTRPPKPTIHALLLCDQAIREEGTGKWTLVGIFTQIRVLSDRTPDVIPHPALAFYVCGSDAKGTYEVKVQLVKLTDEGDRLVAEIPLELEATDVLGVFELAFNLRGLALPGFGRYAFRLTMNGDYMQDKVFDVQDVRGAV